MADERLNSPNQYGMQDDKAPSRGAAVVEVSASDLQGQGVVFCPNPKMPLWSTHPRVFIDVANEGGGKCPYCSTVYRLKAGEKLSHGH